MITEKRGATQRDRARILRSSNKWWEPSALDLPTSTRQHLLTELVRAGELRHVRKGLYWRGVRTPLGMSLPSPDELIRRVAGTSGVGPSGPSAANRLGLSTQVPRRMHVAVPGRAPESIGTVKFESRPAADSRRREGLRWDEVAFLEVLRAWDSVIEIDPGSARGVLARLVTEQRVRPENLARAARSEPARVRARLAEVLEVAGTPEAGAVPAVDARTRKRRALVAA